MPQFRTLAVWIVILSDSYGSTIDAEVIDESPKWDMTPTLDGDTWHTAPCEVIDPGATPREVWFLITRNAETGAITAVDAAALEPAFTLDAPDGHRIELWYGNVNGGIAEPIDIQRLIVTMP
jgi:hypothetical protein